MSLETLLEAARYVEQQEKKRARAASISSMDRPNNLLANHFNHNSNIELRAGKLKRDRTETDDLFCEEKMLIIDEEDPITENNKTNGNHHQFLHQQQHHHSTIIKSNPIISISPRGNTNSPIDSGFQHHLHHQLSQQHHQHQHIAILNSSGTSPSSSLSSTSPPTSSLSSSLSSTSSLTHVHQQSHLMDHTTQQILHNNYLDNNHQNSNHNTFNNLNTTTTTNNLTNINSPQQSLIVDINDMNNPDNKKPRNGQCVIRSGTREVHNKLEKNRRAHLKECFELLKKQLPSQDEKKSSNLSILSAAIRHIQTLKKKERDFEHEMEKLAREKIAAHQRLGGLKKELAATWDHIDFNTIIPDYNSSNDANINKNVSESMDVDVTTLTRSGTRYSSTSSLSSAATSTSPQTLQTTSNSSNSNVHSHIATAAVVSQTQGLNLAPGTKENLPITTSSNSMVVSSITTLPSSVPDKVIITPTVITHPQSQNLQHQLHSAPQNLNQQTSQGQQQQQLQPQQQQPQQQHQQQQQQQQQPQQQQQQQQQQTTQLHLPMLNSQGLATLMPTLQHLTPGLRVIPGDTRQLLVAHTSTAGDSRPLIVQSNNGSDSRHVALVVHSTAPNDNRVTIVHSGNEARPIVLATHPQTINVANAQSRIRTTEASPTTHKVIGGMTLVGSNGSEIARLPGGTELNILPNGVFRSVKGQPITVQGGLALSHAGVSLQTASGKSGSTIVQTPSTETITHIVGQHASLSGLTPIVAPMAVVSQGNQVILAQTTGKMITTPLLKSVTPLMSTQYLNTIVKPVVVVPTSTTNSSSSTTTQPTLVTMASNSSVVTTASQLNKV